MHRSVLRILALLLCLGALGSSRASVFASTWWEVQAIDTMKYSRDLSREKMFDASFTAQIDKQMELIAGTGATHVGIATPYDEEFLPMLRRWVASARQHGLHIWFRGNWSGWEGWFNYPRITREVHIQKTAEFLERHKDLFQDGDIFSACPECENGGPGDPRSTGDVAGYRAFIIAEHELAKNAFASMGKDVVTNWQSMNADVARLVMDKETTAAMDGLVVIDHYVRDPKQVARDAAAIAKQSGGKVVLGEFGAPIPDLHGQMSETQQAVWVESALSDLSQSHDVVGISYWTNLLGSTKLWNDDASPRAVVDVLTNYYTPKTIQGTVTASWGRVVPNAEVTSSEGVRVTTDASGTFALPYLKGPIDISIVRGGYQGKTIRFTPHDEGNFTTIHLTSDGFFAQVRDFFCRLFGKCSA